MTRTTDQVLHALVDLRAVARGNNMQVRMRIERPERRAPRQVRVMVATLSAPLRRGEDPVELIHSMLRSLQRTGITCRRYEDDPL